MKAGGRFRFSGWTAGRRRWVRLFSALGTKWRAPADSWRVEEGVRVLRKTGGDLGRKIGLSGDFLAEKGVGVCGGRSGLWWSLELKLRWV